MAMRGRQREARRGLPWAVIEHHYGSRNKFLAIFRAYEARVAGLVASRGVPREQIQLTAAETVELFDMPRLQALLREEVLPLRDAAHSLFRDHNIDEPYDSRVSRIYHELSILKEEHLSVTNFPREGSAREFARLFEEVSTYYPERLRRVRDLFNVAQRRLDRLLPRFQADPIVLRSAYLFRDRLWPEGPLRGLTRFLRRMFPEEGAARGLLRIGKSFLRAGFYDQAEQCALLGLDREAPAAIEGGAGDDAREEFEKLKTKAGAERRALEEMQAG